MTHVIQILGLLKPVTNVTLDGLVLIVMFVAMDGMVQIVIHAMSILDQMVFAMHAIRGGLVLTVTCVIQILYPQGHVIPV